MSALSMRSTPSTRTRAWFLAGKIWAGYKAYLLRRQRQLAARTLSGLSDYMLKDMGIARSEIYALVRSQSDDQRWGDDDNAG
jgi:uncharacterized protein YjiS (DUF1127 family)